MDIFLDLSRFTRASAPSSRLSGSDLCLHRIESDANTILALACATLNILLSHQLTFSSITQVVTIHPYNHYQLGS